jgi:hypothetical protein
MTEDEDGSWLTVGNEFTTIKIRKSRTRNGERLEIFSPRLGHTIRLDPLELESLTWQEPSTFSRLLETPFGPHHSTGERCLSDLLMPNGDIPHH